MVWLLDGEIFFEDMFIRFDRIYELEGQMDTLRDTARRHRPRLCIT